MARIQNAHTQYWKTPLGHKRLVKSPRNNPKPFLRSPIFSRNLTHGPSTGNKSYLPGRLLASIAEEPEPARSRRSSLYIRDDDTYDKDYSQEVLFQWEEEETLVNALLYDGTPDASNNANLIALADSLQEGFTERGHRVLHDLAGAFVPSTKHVKKVHKEIEKKVETAYGKGLVMVDEACQKMEALTIREEDELKEVYQNTQANIERILDKLKDKYYQRDRLWINLEQDLDKTEAFLADNPISILEALSVLESLKELPAQVEQTISLLERQAKTIDKDDSQLAKAQEQALIQGILSKLY